MSPPGDRIVLVPGVWALLPRHAGLADPVAELRTACGAAVAWLTETRPASVRVLADPDGLRVAEHLLARAGHTGRVVAGSAGEHPEAGEEAGAASYLVVANGSARRGERAPGHLDQRSFGFDKELDRALVTPDPAALARLDVALGAELLAGGLSGLQRLGGLLTARHRCRVDYDDDPFGVQYWVMRWACES